MSLKMSWKLENLNISLENLVLVESKSLAIYMPKMTYANYGKIIYMPEVLWNTLGIDLRHQNDS